ncbi:hypothetical protein KHC23_08335 [Ancylobacter dichloromethanicus]|uniref:DUF6603 domain-containing protein n=1 Tax=Ancylobacter dichloromethanicus TaxID=518825 RepID=A0A9W6J8C2_9HYPH|nr:DUF6603 domain-containing protein [Ancylobacter dichloromethanicus]MBS7553656.1 hypothetical protein [Ancylobacter dichloromethanicus]GLK72720.1 hypothetical protein GCM10017643_28360 [Ancylobacter dichloromethanicus]
MAGGNERDDAPAARFLSTIDPGQFEALGLKDHGCDQLDAWLASLAEGGGTVSARQFALPLFGAEGARSDATRLFVASGEHREVWRPGDAYGALKPAQGAIDKALGLRSVRLCYSSYDFAAVRGLAGRVGAEDRARIGALSRQLDADWPHETAPLRIGINFTGEATLLPDLDAAQRRRFGLERSVRVAGCVGRRPDGHWIEASTELAPEPLALLDGRLSVALVRACVGAERVKPGGATPQFTLGLDGRIALDQQALAASIRVDPGAKRLTLVADAPDPIKAGALVKGLVPEIEAALGGALGAMDTVVPGLRRLEVTAPLTGLDGGRVALWLDYSAPFTLFDLIRFTPSLRATGSYRDTELAFEAELSGIGEIGSGADMVRFETTLSLPEGTFRAGLAEGSTISLPAAFAARLDAVAGRESLQFVDLSITANTNEGSYRFSVITAGFLPFAVGRGTLLIGDVRFELARRRAESLTARLEATLSIGDVDADILIDIDNGMSGTLSVPRLPIGALAADLLQIAAPEELAAVEIDDVEVALTLGEQTSFAFSATSQSPFALAGLTATLATLEVRHEGALSLKGKGKIRFDATEVALDLEYANENWNFRFGADTRFDLGKALGPLASEIGFEPPLPPDSVVVTRAAGALRLGAEGTRIALNFEFKINGGDFRLTLVAARLAANPASGWDYSLKMGPASLDFRSLPVIGGPIGMAADRFAGKGEEGGGKKMVGLDALQLGVLSTLVEADLGALFKNLPATDFPPPGEVGGKVSLAGTLRLLDYEKAIVYPSPKKAEAEAATPAPGEGIGKETGKAPGEVETATPAPATPAPLDKPPSDDMRWLPVQRDCGPLHLARLGVGLRRADGSWEVTAALAGRISLSGVQLELMDAGVSVRIDRLNAPRGRLKGMSLSFKRGAISVEGGFLQVSETVYGGQLSIQLPKVSVGVVGLYGSYEVEAGPPATSLFIYGSLSLTGGAGIRLGALTLTGMALGFGFNRRVVVPAIGEVADFPLVALAMADGEEPKGRPSAMEMLATLEKHLPFDQGQMFAALGLRFTIAETIDAFALAIAQFGREVEFSLLGLARFEKSAGAQKFCRVELAIKMTLRPEEGVFLLQAELTANSWVLDEGCRLTGGFALGVWFAGARKGDFVLTIGGYHRDFKVPAHYPVVPRLGLNWAVTDELTLKGELYCALTPSHLMAGGRLEAAFVKGRIKAWFVAAIDFLLRWAPLEYRLDAGISIRVEAELSIATINLSLDVTLSLWGPPFAGRATVKVSALSFEIAFGGGKASTEIQTWARFGELFLDKASKDWDAVPAAGVPVQGPAICGAALVGGRLSQPGEKPPGGPWIVRGDELVLSVTSLLPATTLAFGTAGGVLPRRGDSGRSLVAAEPLTLAATAHVHAAESVAFGLVPLSVTDARSVLRVTLVKDLAGGVTVPLDLEGWHLVPERQAMPAALWDRQPPGEAPAAKMTGAYLTGLASLKPPAGTRRGEGMAVEVARHRESDRVFHGQPAPEPAIGLGLPAGSARATPDPFAAAHRPRQAAMAEALRGLGLAVDLGAAADPAGHVWARAPHAPPMNASWQQGA